jgi:hypothetical protein
MLRVYSTALEAKSQKLDIHLHATRFEHQSSLGIIVDMK